MRVKVRIEKFIDIPHTVLKGADLILRDDFTEEDRAIFIGNKLKSPDAHDINHGVLNWLHSRGLVGN